VLEANLLQCSVVVVAVQGKGFVAAASNQYDFMRPAVSYQARTTVTAACVGCGRGTLLLFAGFVTFELRKWVPHYDIQGTSVAAVRSSQYACTVPVANLVASRAQPKVQVASRALWAQLRQLAVMAPPPTSGTCAT
jgi:hypothetical protein